MKIRFYGPRGSIPTPAAKEEVLAALSSVCEKALDQNTPADELPSLIRLIQGKEPVFFGGNTPSTYINHDDKHLIIDCGSGIVPLGRDIAKHKLSEYHILLGHYHWDHIHGFPFFHGLHQEGATIHIYCVQENPEAVFDQQMAQPNFPDAWKDKKAKVIFHQLDESKVININGFDVATMKLNHPNVSYGFRVSAEDRSVVYLSDTEVIGADLPEYKRYQEFIGDSQIVIADAQYSFLEYFEKQSWGHSNVMTFIDMLKNNNVKKLYMFHHDPLTDFNELNHQVEMAIRYKDISCPDASFKILAAAEGELIDV